MIPLHTYIKEERIKRFFFIQTRGEDRFILSPFLLDTTSRKTPSLEEDDQKRSKIRRLNRIITIIISLFEKDVVFVVRRLLFASSTRTSRQRRRYYTPKNGAQSAHHGKYQKHHQNQRATATHRARFDNQIEKKITSRRRGRRRG